jgi:hypothetical protein
MPIEQNNVDLSNQNLAEAFERTAEEHQLKTALA